MQTIIIIRLVGFLNIYKSAIRWKYNPFLSRCFDNTVLLKQSAYRNRGLFLGRYCDVSSYNEFMTVMCFEVLLCVECAVK